jgi:hypothetical protein
MGRIKEGLRGLAAAVTSGGGAARSVARDLRQEKPVDGLPAEQRSNAEQAEGSVVTITAVGADKAAAETLQKGSAQVVTAAAETVKAQGALGRATSGEQGARRGQRADEAQAREASRLSEEIDHSRPLIGLRTLAVVELVFLLAEIYFWYQVFTYRTESTMGWLSVERLGAVVLGLAIPTLGLLAARAAGASWQRFLRHPAIDSGRRRHQLGAVVTSTAVLALACAVVYTLVHWRYSPHAGSGSANQAMELPPAPAGLFFAGLILADAVARAFCTSEAAEVARERDKQVEADRAQVKALTTAVTTARNGWHVDWLALRTLVAVTLDSIERIVATGDILVLRSRSRRADRPAATGWATVPAWTDGGSYRVPTVQLPTHLSLGQVPATLQALTAAADTLTRHQPPALAEGLVTREELEDLHRRIRDLQDAVGPTQPDAQPVDGAADWAPAMEADDTGTPVVEGIHMVVPLPRTGSPD